MFFFIAFFVSACLSCTSPFDPIPNFTPFNLAASGTGYIINGTAYENTENTSLPITLVIDPPNNRMGYFLGAGGTYLALASTTYDFGIPGTGGICLQYSTWNYSQQVASYGLSLSTAGSYCIASRYIGEVTDLASCNQRVAYTFWQIGNYINRIDFVQPFPLPGLGCFSTAGSYIFNLATLDTTSNRDAYFVLPAACSTPVPYCPVAYPPGNACESDCGSKKKRGD